MGCRTRRPQAELVRVVATADGRIVVSRVAPGRGAWLCTPPEACWRQAVKRRAFERALRRPVTVAQEIEARGIRALQSEDGEAEQAASTAAAGAAEPRRTHRQGTE
ncbi:YlxR family protein [Desertimonas flava]|uniref:YlxR family protein n=1 Tax=Desertimonas flava TaxID=2064846 RepID=UPI003C6C8358